MTSEEVSGSILLAHPVEAATALRWNSYALSEAWRIRTALARTIGIEAEATIFPAGLLAARMMEHAGIFPVSDSESANTSWENRSFAAAEVEIPGLRVAGLVFRQVFDRLALKARCAPVGEGVLAESWIDPRLDPARVIGLGRIARKLAGSAAGPGIRLFIHRRPGRTDGSRFGLLSTPLPFPAAERKNEDGRERHPAFQSVLVTLERLSLIHPEAVGVRFSLRTLLARPPEDKGSWMLQSGRSFVDAATSLKARLLMEDGAACFQVDRSHRFPTGVGLAESRSMFSRLADIVEDAGCARRALPLEFHRGKPLTHAVAQDGGTVNARTGAPSALRRGRVPGLAGSGQADQPAALRAARVEFMKSWPAPAGWPRRLLVFTWNDEDEARLSSHLHGTMGRELLPGFEVPHIALPEDLKARFAAASLAASIRFDQGEMMMALSGFAACLGREAGDNPGAVLLSMPLLAGGRLEDEPDAALRDGLRRLVLERGGSLQFLAGPQEKAAADRIACRAAILDLVHAHAGHVATAGMEGRFPVVAGIYKTGWPGRNGRNYVLVSRAVLAEGRAETIFVNEPVPAEPPFRTLLRFMNGEAAISRERKRAAQDLDMLPGALAAAAGHSLVMIDERLAKIADCAASFRNGETVISVAPIVSLALGREAISKPSDKNPKGVLKTYAAMGIACLDAANGLVAPMLDRAVDTAAPEGFAWKSGAPGDGGRMNMLSHVRVLRWGAMPAGHAGLQEILKTVLALRHASAHVTMPRKNPLPMSIVRTED